MFYIVESDSQIEKLKSYGKSGYVEIISNNDYIHPKLSTTVALYIRPLKSNKGYILPIDHDEGINISKERVSQVLESFDTLYTLNRKDFIYHFNTLGLIDISLIYSMENYERLDIFNSNKTYNYFYSKNSNFKDINKLIPLSKHHEKCEENFSKVESIIGFTLPKGFDFYNETCSNVFYLIEQQGLGIFYEAFNELFKPKNPLYNIYNNTVLTSYNLYNATSRPTNAHNSINFAAIPKSEKHRKCFKPQNDKFVEFDFDGYHLRLLCDQINFKLTEESAHKQLAKLYFNKEEITEDEYAEAKQLNFQAIYGKIPKKHKNLEIFKLIQKYIDDMWETFVENGVVYNPQTGKPFSDILKRMNPAKLMNYMMQSLETSNNILILKDVLRYLKDKKTKIALYTYDAILFDFSKEDGKQTLLDIERIMSRDNKFPVKFKFSQNLVL